ncbi:MAG TPA: GGDEF domain-containing protein [Bdellovibrionota bacterium]|nr:GGDEF domain-containing protein [Bdellovibrionota bacterium]
MAEQTVVKRRKPGTAEKSRERIPCLVVLEGSYIGEVYRITGDSVLIGREEDSGVILLEEGVSRQHARIDRHEMSYTITDLGSTNGTFVNGEPVQQAALHDGDKVRIGDVVVRFSYQDTMDVNYQETLRNMAMRDGLTKVFNRRYFLESLDRELNYAARLRQSLTCILLDIDHFKKVNDTYGHQAGDAVLRAIANALQQEIRRYDVLARYGGEEFVILLRATALDNALLLAERLRRLSSELEFVFDQKNASVTVSLGVASFDPDNPKSGDDLVREADRYLYEAKERGRNRVCSKRTQGTIPDKDSSNSQ